MKNKYKIFVSVISLLAFIIATGYAGDNSKDFGYVPGEILLKFKNGVQLKEQTALLKAFGLKVKKEIVRIKVKAISVPEEAQDEIISALAHNPKVEFVENNYLAKGALVPNDPNYQYQWYLPKISAPEGWDISTGKEQMIIAVIDSGVNPSHPDLAAKLVAGYNFLSANTDTHDVLGHGTAVAGTAGAISNNAVGVSGVAWQNQIMPLVVLNASDYATYSDIASAIIFAADHGAKVINISIGGTSNSSTMQNAVDYAWQKGAVIVACAMNANTSTPYYPAALNNVIAVTATDSNDNKASFSNYGDWIDLSAPGVSIYTTNNNGSYGYWSGTSFSSPITAGLVALVFSVNPLFTNTQVVDLMKNNSDDLGNQGFDIYYGWGRVNLFKTLYAAKLTNPEIDTTSPLVEIVSPSDGKTVSGAITISVSATDNISVTKVELRKDGLLLSTDTSSPYAFYWDTSKELNGAHTLVANAYDSSGNIGTSALVTIWVNNILDATPPAVIISQPANNSRLPSKGSVTILVNASDDVGVTEIDILFDGVVKASSFNTTTCSYKLNTAKVKTGTHTISANAYDNAKNTASSSIVVIK